MQEIRKKKQEKDKSINKDKNEQRIKKEEENKKRKRKDGKKRMNKMEEVTCYLTVDSNENTIVDPIFKSLVRLHLRRTNKHEKYMNIPLFSVPNYRLNSKVDRSLEPW